MRYMLLLLFLSTVANSQTLRITDILDANQFVSAGGDTFQLAGISMPSVTAADSVQRAKAKFCIEYAQNHLLRHSFKYEFMNSSQGTAVPHLHLFYRFTIGRRSVNENMLTDGIGTFKPVDDSKWNTRFRRAANAARANNAGIWNEQRFQPKPPDRYHHRARLFANVATQGLDATSMQEPGIIPSFNHRWSYLQRDRLSVQPFTELGDYYFLMPYFNAGLETGVQKKWYVEAHVGAAYLMVWPPFGPFYIAGWHAGVFLAHIESIHLEMQLGIQWMQLQDHDMMFPRIGIGISGR